MLSNYFEFRLLRLALLGVLLALSGIVLAGGPTSSFTITPGTIVPTGTCVSFVDGSSANNPPLTAWDWTFDGQAPNFSGQVPPCVTYNTPGAYDVCLTVTESDGDDNQSCQTVNVYTEYNIGTENGNTINACGVMLTDDGGFTGNYSNNQNNVVTYCSGSTDIMEFALKTISLGAGDNITIYEGSGTGGPVLATYTSANNGQTPTVVAINTCITIQFQSDGSGVDAGFMGIASCVPDNYYIISGYNGQTITDCGSGTFWDPGGPGGSYGNNQYYTITFCTDNPTTVVQLPFTSGITLSAGDQINFYDGTGTGGTLIYTAESTDNQGWSPFFSTGLTVTGHSQCITAEFISNGSGTSSGWGTQVNCVTPPAPCNSNPIASDNFDGATMVCDLSQYCGTTSSFYGIDMEQIAQTSVFDGSIENNSWLQFVADATTATFDLNVTNCSAGIQIGIYSVDNNENFTWMSPESVNGGLDYTSVDNGFVGSGILNATGLVPGETYYIMVDGHGGAVCDYSLGASIGVQVPAPVTTPTVPTCAGETGDITVVDGNGGSNVDWQWTWDNGTGGPMTGDQIDLSGFPAGTYEFVVTADEFGDCAAASAFDTISVVIAACPLPVELSNFDVVCTDSYKEISWMTVSEYNNDYFVVERANESMEFEELEIVQGAGSTLATQSYMVKDENRPNEVSYYRIKQVDYDGSVQFSDIISSNICDESGFVIQRIYYDENNDEIIVEYLAERTTEINLNIIDLHGRSMMNDPMVLQPTDNNIRISAHSLKGNVLYFVNITSNDTVDTGKLILNK